MNNIEFEKIVEEELDKIRQVLISKNKEYSTGDDRLSAFKIIAQADEITPAEALWGMYLKHWGSVRKIVKDSSESKFPSKELLSEKINDSIVYHILLKAIILENI